MAERLKEIEKSAEEIVESFVKAAEKLPELRETYYSQEAYNIVRPDGRPTPPGERSEFRKRFISNMPGSDDQGNLKVEVARWAGER
jgi:predicted Asp-tRNA(Asn)/Glu-tRNA(Gln) amidotransferase subunit C